MKAESKKLVVYGVEMTSLEEMQFAKYRSDNGISMNTLTESERTALTKIWKAERDKSIAQILRGSLIGLLNSYKADFENITGAPLNQTEAVKGAEEAIQKATGKNI